MNFIPGNTKRKAQRRFWHNDKAAPSGGFAFSALTMQDPEYFVNISFMQLLDNSNYDKIMFIT